MPKDLLHVSTIPLPEGKRLSQKQYREVEKFLEDWKQEVLTAVKTHPKKSYALGRAQAESFLKLLGRLNTVQAPGTLGPGPTTAFAVKWLNTYTLHELDTALTEYTNRIKDTLLYGLQSVVDPLQVAAWLYKATGKAEINWRTIARTEMVRANAAGRLAVCREQGYDMVWAPPHVGACKSCRRLIENKVFRISDVEGVTNFGRDQRDWVACIPIHPHCRHCWLPYIPEVYDELQRQYQAFEDAGLNDKVLNEMFEESGQLKPEYKDDPRLAAFKVADPFAHAMAHVIEKVRSDATVSKGFFDNPQAGLDPLLWDGRKLKPEIRSHVVAWWRETLGDDAPLWSRVYLMGGATSPQWDSYRQPEPDPDVDLQIIVDYPRLREKHEEWKVLSDPELHGVLVTRIKTALVGVEVAPGVRLDAFIRPETTYAEFEADARTTGQAVYDVTRHRWLVRPDFSVPVERFGVPIMEGIGAQVAIDHPDWVREAEDLCAVLTRLLDEYGETGNAEVLEALQRFYTRAHDARHEGFEGGGGNTSQGNFIWQYLVNYGPLMRVKYLLNGDSLKTVAPDYVWGLPVVDDDVWRVTKSNHWPLPTGTEVRIADGVDVVKVRVGPGVYQTLTGQEISHASIQAHVAKVAPSATEHWITVHPNGPDEKGIPVLVREMGDGSMMVIGGAGGNLNHLRLDPKRRIEHKPKDTGTSDELQGPKVEEHPEMTPEEAEREQQQREQEYQQAKEQSQVIQDQKRELHQQMFDYVKSTIPLKIEDKETGEIRDASWDELDEKDAAQKINAAIKDALKTLAHEKLAVQDTQDSGITLRAPNFDSMPEEPKDPFVAEDGEDGEKLMDEAEAAEAEAAKLKQGPKLSIGKFTLEQAGAIQSLRSEMSLLNKQLRGYNAVVRGQSKIADALSLDYTNADVEEHKAAAVASELRTDVARDIAEAVDGERNQRSLNKAMTQGAYDTVDTFAQGILGHSAINRDVHDLLGTAGMAQLVSWKLHKEAKTGKVDLDAAFRSLTDLSNDRETIVSQRAVARSREAAATAKEMYEEIAASEKGESLYTTTAARSLAQRKINEAACSLGMAIAGHEAASALKVAMSSSYAEKELRIGGFKTQAALLDAAQRVGLDSKDASVTKHGPGDYELRVNPEKLEHLFQKQADPRDAIRKKIADIRTLDDEAKVVADEQTNTPYFSDTLEPAQAKGKMFLKAAGNGLLAFAPGVGKTHTALAAAFEQMAEMEKNGETPRVLIAAPAAVQQDWLDTIKKQGGHFSAQIVGQKDVRDRASGEMKSGYDSGLVGQHIANPAHLNIVSHDLVANHPEKLAAMGAHIVILDEAQTIKNEKTQRHVKLDAVSQGARNRWALTGTPLEKNAGEFYNIVKWAKGEPETTEDLGAKTAFKKKYDSLAQYQHLTAEDRIRQFREGMGDSVYSLSAGEGGTPLPSKNGGEMGETQVEHVPLTPEHENYVKGKIKEINEAHQDWLDRKKAGEVGLAQPKISQFGGAAVLRKALLNPDAQMVPTPAHFDAVEKLISENPNVDYKGQTVGNKLLHSEKAGLYAPKSVVFSSKIDANNLPGLKKHLEAKGHKVFMVTGGDKEKTRAELKRYLAHKGPATLLATDTIKTGVSLQFGSNKGSFQHGATRLIHLDTPDNNADIAQREARIHRKGAAAPVTTHKLDFGTGAEAIQQDRLSQERRTQDLVGNPEDEVRTHEGGMTETIPQRYDRAKADESVGTGREYQGEGGKEEYPSVPTRSRSAAGAGGARSEVRLQVRPGSRQRGHLLDGRDSTDC
jgi:hypothetical protein